MNQVLQTNVFFIITAVAVVGLSVIMAVALYFLVRILKNVRDISDLMLVGTTALSKDIIHLRQKIKEEAKEAGQYFRLLKIWKTWFPSKRIRKKKEALP
ncbi:MAG: hypothetical protein K8R92_03570 [Planctomycetes bacterium]|nr:hypothetical protein [Planctomycetota bacterium]